MKLVFFFAIGWIATASVIAFILCGADKLAAKTGKERTPEKKFFILALSGGALGLCLGMLIFNHKTRHIAFTIAASLGMVLWAGILFLLSINCLF
ncbi:MAG: DUF1294 domain-containing protein [Oscillospiraceae bacterium]|nr:DUF1294 domain-containing protein [Oscillospiraceae bacterium]